MNQRFFKWFCDNYGNEVENIYNLGIDAGFTNLIYYTDREKIYDQWVVEIWEILEDRAEDFGYDGGFRLIANDRRSEFIDSVPSFKGLAVWLAIEFLTFEYMDALERVIDDLDWNNLGEGDKQFIYAQKGLTPPDDLTFPSVELYNQLVIEDIYSE